MVFKLNSRPVAGAGVVCVVWGRQGQALRLTFATLSGVAGSFLRLLQVCALSVYLAEQAGFDSDHLVAGVQYLDLELPAAYAEYLIEALGDIDGVN